MSENNSESLGSSLDEEENNNNKNNNIKNLVNNNNNKEKENNLVKKLIPEKKEESNFNSMKKTFMRRHDPNYIGNKNNCYYERLQNFLDRFYKFNDQD